MNLKTLAELVQQKETIQTQPNAFEDYVTEYESRTNDVVDKKDA